jgi:hypothetical protein
MASHLVHFWMVWAVLPIGLEAGSVRFSAGFPLMIPMTGSAVVMGHTRASTGYKLGSAEVRYWIDGGVIRNAKTHLREDGGYNAIISGLKPGTQYNVIIDVIQIKGNEKQTLRDLSRITAR